MNKKADILSVKSLSRYIFIKISAKKNNGTGIDN